jgi:hypothetical protein
MDTDDMPHQNYYSRRQYWAAVVRAYFLGVATVIGGLVLLVVVAR